MVFVGHEFDRKGLHPLIAALVTLPPYLQLVVVGGTPDMVAHEGAGTSGVADRVHFVGRVADPRPYLHAGDVFALPSSYPVVPTGRARGAGLRSPGRGHPDGLHPGPHRARRERVRRRGDPSAIAQALLDLDGYPAKWSRPRKGTPRGTPGDGSATGTSR